MTFKRGLSDDIHKILQGQPTDGWWHDILQHNNLSVAIRNNYINAYSNGQSIFMIYVQNCRLCAETNYKYLLGHTDSEYCRFIENNFEIGDNRLIDKYKGAETLDKIISNAKNHAGTEKKCVHTLVQSRYNSNVLDLEIAFTTLSAKAGGDNMSDEKALEKNKIDRIDIAALETAAENKINVVFYEIKTFEDVRLRADKELPEIVAQLRRYEQAIRSNIDDIRLSYQHICADIVTIGRPTGRPGKINPLVSKISSNPELLDVDPLPRLIITRYGEDQWEGPTWKPHLEKLGQELGRDRVIGWGNASNVRIGPEKLGKGSRPPGTRAWA